MTKHFVSPRRGFVLALTLTGMAAFSPALPAQVLTAYEPFAYPSGPVGGQNGGANWGGAWTTAAAGNTVSASGLTFGPLVTSGGMITTTGNNNGNFRTLTGSQGAPGTSSWVSLLANLSSGASFANSYNGLSLFQANTERLFIGQPFTSSHYGFQQPGQPQQNSSTIIDATTHFLVLSLDFGATTTTINMYVDPTPGLATPDVAAAVANYSIPNFVFDNIRIEGGTAVNALLNFDEVRLGNSYAAVSPVPEPGSLALMGVASIGWVTFWRRRWQSNGPSATLSA